MEIQVKVKSTVSTRALVRSIRLIFSFINNTQNYYLKKIMMTVMLYVLGYARYKYLDYETQDFQTHDTSGKRQNYLYPYSLDWIQLPKNRKELEESFSKPYLTFYPPKAIKNLPDVNDVVKDLFKIQGERRLHPLKPNGFFTWFANYFIENIMNSTLIDHIPHNRMHKALPLRMIYGSTLEEEQIIRAFQGGTVRLRDDGTPLRANDVSKNWMNNPYHEDVFICGSDRANISVGLYVMHTLWLRNHNKLCKKITEINSSLDDEQVFQLAKSINWYQMLRVVVGPYLRAISGLIEIKSDYLSKAVLTNSNMNICWEYNIIYQWHAMTPHQYGNQSIEEMAFHPTLFYQKSVGDWIRLGLTTQAYEHRLNNTPDFLLHVEQRNLHLCRQIELLSYCEMRRKLHLSVPKSFVELTEGDLELAARMEKLYGDIENVEFYVGCLAEPRYSAISLFGETHTKILAMVAIGRISGMNEKLRDYINFVDSRLLSLVDQFKYFDEFVAENLTETEKLDLAGKEIQFFVSD